MSAVNPYTPPRALVDDVSDQTQEFSTPKIWSASGRIGRLRYLAYLMVGYLAVIVGGGIVAAIVGMGTNPMVAVGAFYLALIPYAVFSVLCGIQRAHDMGWSGWTVLLSLIPFVAFVWLFNPGTKGVNRFGAPPIPNSTGVKIGAFAALIIPAMGILAAIALPAYQQYTVKAKAAQARMQQQQQQQPQEQQ